MVESCLRFFDYPRYFMNRQQRSPNAWRALIHRPSAIPGLAYELAPNMEKYSVGAMIKTNSSGMRDDEPQPKDDDSSHRIAIMGDSYTFGFGVPGDQAYPSVLEHLLNARMNGEKFETLNFGVGGYSTRDEALLLKHRAINWDLDLVVLGYVLNDPEIDPIQPLHAYYRDPVWWQNSNLLRLIAKAKRDWDVLRLGSGDYFRYLHSTKSYKWQSAVDALEDIESVAAAKEIPVLLVIFPFVEPESWANYPYKELHQQVADAANEVGIHVVDLYEDMSGYSAEALMVIPDDSHPSQLGHKVAAEAIYQWIAENLRVPDSFATSQDPSEP